MPEVVPVFLVITAVIAWLNARYLKLPSTIGVMAAALMLSALTLLLDHIGYGLPRDYAADLFSSIDFSDVLMEGMLSILLFAGALQVDLRHLAAYRWQVGTLAVFGTVAAALLVGAGLFYLLPLAGLHLPFSSCLVFGALIAPTDPISVTALLRKVGAPANLETVISGESLFNDGVGIVVFTIMTTFAAEHHAPGGSQTAMLLMREAGGGIAYGLALGAVTYQMLKSIDSYQEEVLLSVAAVLGGYSLAHVLEVSGPLAMVAAGILIGNRGRRKAMSDLTREQLDQFWELLDSMLNAVLFVLIGFEALVLPFSGTLLGAGLMAVCITLFARLLTAGLPVAVLGSRSGLPKGAWQVLTWGGLRGGISVALALALPPGAERDAIVTMTYIVVVFSVLVQGLTVEKLVRKVVSCPPPDEQRGKRGGVHG
ncbi:sodium/proton antiporter, CPA1 family (TC 2.A.36) [Pseudoduganella flava]|uniref:Sodium/proton antiporter, CPA1 family (TC 2.A.36) n=1 Tax=Pseudoduganella flava TaxID=871742 RepID=A0A562PQB9_9BURK|nr:sodium:proton antiporter [Pseudoduganella flava]QGZ37787.1 sodium:proton antiporter [Pseudoduganella flava]TWI46599.1 sodium/proton antiporter, CPA1 family (TC 2.A.36) [Pseudoduganella flava]